MTDKQKEEMKKLAAKYSMIFVDRKTMRPDPKLAIAFEAGFKAGRNEI